MMAEKCYEFVNYGSASALNFTIGKKYQAEEFGGSLRVRNDKGIMCLMRKQSFKECEPTVSETVVEPTEEDEEITIEMDQESVEKLKQYAMERGITPEVAIVEILKAELESIRERETYFKDK